MPTTASIICKLTSTAWRAGRTGSQRDGTARRTARRSRRRRRRHLSLNPAAAPTSSFAARTRFAKSPRIVCAARSSRPATAAHPDRRCRETRAARPVLSKLTAKTHPALRLFRPTSTAATSSALSRKPKKPLQTRSSCQPAIVWFGAVNLKTSAAPPHALWRSSCPSRSV